MPRVSVIAWLAVGSMVACWRATPPAASAFTISHVSPAEVETDGLLMLNDSITVYFSDAIYPLSVTSDSVTVLDGAGHAVPGTLRTGTNWATFVPEVPLDPDLGDGSFRPGEVYRLVIAGYPRLDAVRAADGRRLESVRSFEIRMAGRGECGELPAPLRPPATDMPFLLRPYKVPQQLPADAPRLRLHFTLPVLPASAAPDAFVIQLARGGVLHRLLPRSVRVLNNPRLDQYPGSTVEIDLGSEPRLAGGDETHTLALQKDDWLNVTMADVPHALRDLSGNGVLPGWGQPWIVVGGATLALLTWPADDGGIVGDDPLWPGFESLSGIVRPRLRVEAGDGSLGVLRPQTDLVLQPGIPFDRGDGVMVQSRGSQFPFLAIDVPAGVRVRLDGHGAPMHLLASGGIRIDGTLELAAATATLSQPPFQHGGAVADLIEQSPTALVAGGDVWVGGEIVTATELRSNQTALTIASAGRIHLAGDLPYNTILGVESSGSRKSPAIDGARGQTFPTSVTFTYGAPPGAAFPVRGTSPWRRLPVDRDGGILRHVAVDRGIRVAWQAAPADPVQPDTVDLRPDRVPRMRTANDGEWVGVEPGSFVRFAIEAEIRNGEAPPRLRELRLVDR